MTDTLACLICAHAKKHVSWPPGHRGTHCSDCHLSWRAPSHAHCTVCHEQFGGWSTAETHWTLDGHVHPGTVARLVQGDTGVWHERAEHSREAGRDAPESLSGRQVPDRVFKAS